VSRVRAGIERHPWGAISAFLLPAFTVYVALTAYPVLRTFYNSFHRVLPRKGDELVGFANYAELVRDELFWRAVRVPSSGPAPPSRNHDRAPARVGLLLPHPGWTTSASPGSTPVLMSYIVVGIIWVWIYNYDWGAANALLRALGLEGLAHAWLGDPKVALPALIFVTSWMWAGFNMVVLLAALHSLPSEVIEAAELDNCGWGGKLWFVIIH
jgi:multiple sugar transport system permease protein/raffinose/stachyose/melibiose transport system permease protein